MSEKSVKKILKKSRLLVIIVRFFRKWLLFIECKIQFCFVTIYILLRTHNILHDARFDEIKKLRNKYEGRRCFVIGNGPSVRDEDLIKLNDEITFATNNMIVEAKAGRKSLKPSYYVVADIGAYKNARDSLDFLNDEKILIGVRPFPGLVKTALDFDNIPKDKYVIFPTDCCDIWFDINYYPKKAKFGFSDDASCIVKPGATTLYSVIQIAAYMGFEKIYLYGVDNNYAPYKMHFYEGETANIGSDTAYEMNENQRQTWIAARDFSNKRKFEIINATRGGALDVFDRVDFDSLFEV